jgi:hypothetical protein
MKRSETDLGKATAPGTGRSYPELGRPYLAIPLDKVNPGASPD